MSDHRRNIALWVSREILPHEGKVRSWLARGWGGSVDVDDVIQESYCRLSELTSVSHIQNGQAYFFRTARSVVMDGMRRKKVINLADVMESGLDYVMDEQPLADRVVEAKQELALADRLLGTLSWTCRRVIELRRIQGLSQKETALRLGVSESVVENHVTRGLKRVLKAMKEDTASASQSDWTDLGGN